MEKVDSGLVVLIAFTATVACSGSGSGPLSSTGGSFVSGGAVNVGGTNVVGGRSGTAGATVTGGVISTGGVGGNASTVAVGGITARGGTANAGGSKSTTSASANGGASTLGGATSTGGTSASGGTKTATTTPAQGGTTSTATSGGTSSVGGSGGTSSTKPSGGTTSVGGAVSNTGPAYMPAFIIGADISRVQESEAKGTVFKDVDGSTPAGTTSTGGGLLTILKNHGFNYVRLRLFVDPTTAGGYSSAGYCNLAHTLTFAAGVKKAGMGLLLDFHYSDTWADPANQTKPVAWANLSFADLTTKVYSYTKDVITQLKGAGSRPDMVQIGNEIPQGMLWDATGAIGGTGGKVKDQSFDNLAALLSAGIRGVKEVDTNIKIMLHLDRCNDLATNKWWVTGVQGKGVQFDILGESCYDRANYQQPTSAWSPTFADLATTYPNLLFLAAEYSDSKQLVNDTIFNIPNKRGLGTFIWEPTNWGEMAFDSNGRAISQYMTVYDHVAATYGKR